MKVLFDEKHVGTTKVIKKNSNPQWNEKILLIDYNIILVLDSIDIRVCRNG